MYIVSTHTCDLYINCACAANIGCGADNGRWPSIEPLSVHPLVYSVHHPCSQCITWLAERHICSPPPPAPKIPIIYNE